MVATVFIDGEAGTTGLRIRDRLEGRRDIRITSIDPVFRKDPQARRDHLNAADAVILCLPDVAALDSVAMIENDRVKVIDASTAHRTTEGWTYGFPEMSKTQRAVVAQSRRVSNPGCYATGFIALIRPLVEAGLIPPTWPFTVNAVSGYSGGGRPMIAEFEDSTSPDFTRAVFRTYGNALNHKHVPEMQAHARLTTRPLFTPAVGRFHQGMIVEVPLQLAALSNAVRVSDLRACLRDAYEGQPFIEVASLAECASAAPLDPESLNGTNRMQLYIFGDNAFRQARMVAVLDNLGKGASGAAVQNLNLMLDLPETTGL